MTTATTATIQHDRRDWAAEQTVAWLPLITSVVRGMQMPLPLEDLVQEAATRVFLSLQHRYDESKGSVKTFVYSQAYYAVLDAARESHFLSGNQRRKTHEHIERLDRVVTYDDTGRARTAVAEIEDRPTVRVDMDFWRKQLAGHSKRMRIAVLSYYVLGNTMREIGDQLGVVETRISQMLKEFRDERRETVGAVPRGNTR